MTEHNPDEKTIDPEEVDSDEVVETDTPDVELDSDSDSGNAQSDYISERAFSDFPLSPEVLRSIHEKGYTVATQVQAMTLEPALAGKDLVVRSKTGTGKTAAFSIPIIERIKSGDRKVRAIMLTPTRELARQVAEECAELSKYKDIRVTVIYGGVGFASQEEALRDGTEIVVGTPGRILDHIRRKNLDLSTIQFAVLDEADEMLSMGFYQDVSKILDQTPTEGRQVLMFSATVDDRVRALIQKYTNDAQDMRLSTDTDKVENITHVLYETSPDFHKVRALLALIDQESPEAAIIFCNTREDTGTVATYLARQGLDVELISGELPQNKREEVMRRIKSREVQYLVATDVAARGIDISHLSHVINYSLPGDPAVYLHRTGRTGRIGRKGIALSLTGGADLHTRLTLERQYEIDFEVRPLPTAQEAAAARVDRQAKAIKKAMGTMAFEGYITTVREIKKRDDGDLLFAAALRAFFLWDRMRKAQAEEGASSVEALHQARDDKRSRDRDRDGGRSRGGGRSRDGDGGGGGGGGGGNRRRRRPPGGGSGGGKRD
ncbi:MAG: ATP-dependent RNA helicase DeaD [Myxococcota bacterium]